MIRLAIFSRPPIITTRWKITPQVTHIKYFVEQESGSLCSSMEFAHDQGAEWQIESLRADVILRNVCQELRFECLRVILGSTISLNVRSSTGILNHLPQHQYHERRGPGHGESPAGRCAVEKAKHLAVGFSFWWEWEFCSIYGLDVSDGRCPGCSGDDTRE